MIKRSTCETCRFFHTFPDPTNKSYEGECRKTHPKTIWCEGTWANDFGLVNNTDWCGEWDQQNRLPSER